MQSARAHALRCRRIERVVKLTCKRERCRRQSASQYRPLPSPEFLDVAGDGRDDALRDRRSLRFRLRLPRRRRDSRLPAMQSPLSQVSPPSRSAPATSRRPIATRVFRSRILRRVDVVVAEIPALARQDQAAETEFRMLAFASTCAPDGSGRDARRPRQSQFPMPHGVALSVSRPFLCGRFSKRGGRP